MKSDSIKALLADPNIDPTEWVGKALITWIVDNPLVILNDTNARKYLFQGMDLDDARVLVKGVIEQYKKSQNPHIVHEFLNSFKLLIRNNASSYNLEWKVNRVITDLQTVANTNIVEAIIDVKIPGGGYTYQKNAMSTPTSRFWSLIKPEHVRKIIKNWNPASWGSSHWAHMIDMIPRDELYEYAVSDLIPNCLNQSVESSNYPYKVQKILWRIFLKIPSKHARGWLTFLETTNFDRCWTSCRETLISKRREEYKIYFDGTVCTCGRVAARASGLTLHKKKCSIRPGLIESARWLVAQTDRNMCNKCGKTCNTSSGATLHRKTCQVDRFDYITDLRHLRKKDPLPEGEK